MIDDKQLFKKELKDITIKNLLANPIPYSLSHFYIALWYPDFIKTKPEFYQQLNTQKDVTLQHNQDQN